MRPRYDSALPNQEMNGTRNKCRSHPQSFVLAGYPLRSAATADVRTVYYLVIAVRLRLLESR